MELWLDNSYAILVQKLKGSSSEYIHLQKWNVSSTAKFPTCKGEFKQHLVNIVSDNHHRTYTL